MNINDLQLGYSMAEESLFFDEMSGWVKFQPILAEITDLDEIRKRLKYELDYSHRQAIVSRLIQRYNKLRSKEVEKAYNEYCHPKG